MTRGGPIIRHLLRFAPDSQQEEAVIAAGLKPMTVLCMSPEGMLPYWHQREDTFDKLDLVALERAGGFVWGILREADKPQGHKCFGQGPCAQQAADEN